MKKCIAVVLAGGRGTRLKELTKTMAKPVVPFGGKYRIIDFVLSNCRNSGIDKVSVLAHHYPQTLESYVGDGKNWGLNISIPPVLSRFSEGTAQAVYQNIKFIEQQNPKYVLILSSDHVYKMDYGNMLEEHIKNNADVTISSIHVPAVDAKRFGILEIEETSKRIIGFEEKPKKPKSTLASMGIYIYSWEKLKGYLKESTIDFAKDVIPEMIQDGCQMYAYPYKGYWKDVGTVYSLWEAHMDLLSLNENLILKQEEWKIHTNEVSLPPSYLDENATVKKSLISEGCKVFGSVENSVLFPGVIVEEGANVKDSVLFPYSIIGENAVITRSIIGNGAIIEPNVCVGTYPFGEITLIGNDRIVLKEVFKKAVI